MHWSSVEGAGASWGMITSGGGGGFGWGIYMFDSGSGENGVGNTMGRAAEGKRLFLRSQAQTQLENI